jgi:hypothetical protein
MTNGVELLFLCWSVCVLTEPLEPQQHSALMNVYDSLGASRSVDHESFCKPHGFVSFLSGRLQRDSVPSIQCGVGLCWKRIDVWRRQCHSVVRSRKRGVFELSADS